MNKGNFEPVSRHIDLTTGGVIKMLGELKGWTQVQLFELTGINSKNISLLENDRVDIGEKRNKQLAKAFKVHPAIIIFPEYETVLMLSVA